MRLSTTRDKIVAMSPIIVIPAILYYTGLAYGLILVCTCWATHHIAYHLGYLGYYNEELFKKPPPPDDCNICMLPLSSLSTVVIRSL